MCFPFLSFSFLLFFASLNEHLTNPITSQIYRTHLFLGKPDTEENRKGFVSTIPLGRPSTPADIANACCYLASDEAEFITGVNLEVCVD
jgi:NAD(P)-dependent dehydrogenase (short-subunit alcohol dehydrogenase family)